MSFRYYPRYVKGNPQLRVFLPNFWLKLVPNHQEMPENCVTFKAPLVMTDADIRNYLEKIYKIPVVHLKTFVPFPELKRAPGKEYLIKAEEDIRYTYVKLPSNMKFTFPELFPKEKIEEMTQEYEHMKKMQEKTQKAYNKKNWDRCDVPTWFQI
ncbi:39S ribosomal protein L23-like protein [Dinothrombium tinctorium]|uniref:Large ribosomal subunit protein uL23m n=1 Tax=Dinothrombium tinctorium TaxID=1965070 RepID=A0A3S3SLI6_9ACAR|nr:39S ribosomal protein L23-like protein [Dinothrombium tinctorium]